MDQLFVRYMFGIWSNDKAIQIQRQFGQ